MKRNTIFHIINNLFQYIYDLVKLNLLFITFSFRGLLVLGLFPALVSLLYCSRLKFFKKNEDSLWCLFREAYKNNFTQANVIGWILTILGLILYANYKVILNINEELPFFIIFCFYTLIFIYTVVLVWIFPLISYHHNKIKQHLENALVLGVTNISRTILMLFVIFVISYISLAFPAFLLFFTISFTCVICLRITKKPLKKVNLKFSMD